MDFGWFYDGVNSSVPRNAGPECADYASLQRKLVESVIVTVVCVMGIKWAITRLKPIPTLDRLDNENNLCIRRQLQQYDGGGGMKEILLTAMSITFGIELGFKFATRSVIYILNPCHITTLIQIYLLAARPSKTVTVLFRIQMNFLNGPLLAFLFPETDSRVITMETATYWVQHGLMFVIPIYLLRIGGAYNMESITDLSWNIISYASLLIYHFVVLNIMSLPTQVNLNHMLCPALADPFEGPYYRIAACFHQALLCPLLCKLYCIFFTPSSSNSNYLEPKPSTSSSSGTLKLKNGGNKVIIGNDENSIKFKNVEKID